MTLDASFVVNSIDRPIPPRKPLFAAQRYELLHTKQIFLRAPLVVNQSVVLRCECAHSCARTSLEGRTAEALPRWNLLGPGRRPSGASPARGSRAKRRASTSG